MGLAVCFFVRLHVFVCACVSVWLAAMLLDSRWHHGRQGRGCLAQLIRQLRIGQLGGLLASRVGVCVCECVCVSQSAMMLTVVGPLAR